LRWRWRRTIPATSAHHKQSGGGAGLFDAGLAADQIKSSDALAALKPLLESAGILRSASTSSSRRDAGAAWHHAAHVEDAQLMSYAIDAGRNAQRARRAHRALARPCRASAMAISSAAARTSLTFDQVEIDKATAYRPKYADVILRLWQVMKPRLIAERMNVVYETLERPLVSVLARMERRGNFDRPPGVVAAIGPISPRPRPGLKPKIQQIAGEPSMSAAPSNSADIIFGKMDCPAAARQRPALVDLGAGAR